MVEIFFLFGLLRVFSGCCLFRRRWDGRGVGGVLQMSCKFKWNVFQKNFVLKTWHVPHGASCGETQRQPIGCEFSQINAKTEQESDRHRIAINTRKQRASPTSPPLPPPAVNGLSFWFISITKRFRKIAKSDYYLRHVFLVFIQIWHK